MKLPRWLRWRTDHELDEEIQGHLEAEVQANLERGLAPDEAHYAALRNFGNLTRMRERAREADPFHGIESVWRDLRYAIRGLARNPGFTAAAVLSLALGIGVNSAMFSLADAILLRPLDVPHPGNLVRVYGNTPEEHFGNLSYLEYTAYRDRNRTLSGLVAEQYQFFALQDRENEQARPLWGELVSGNYISVLGFEPILGRPFLPQEDSPAAKDIVALLSYQCWQVKFRGNPHITGTRIKLNGQSAVIIGVMPPEFRGTGDIYLRPEIFVPLAATPRLFPSSKLLTDAADQNLSLLGRLKPGVTLGSAQAECAALTQDIEQVFPKSDRQRAVVLPEAASRIEQDQDDLRLIRILLAIAAMVLLVACANVANLLLGRASSRVKEISIRQAVGASRGRLIVQMLTESALLTALGGAAGLVFSQGAIGYFTSIPLSGDFPGDFRARMDGRVLGYTLIAMVVSVLVFGLWPAIRASRVDLISPARGPAPKAGHARRLGGRNALVAVQTALVLMLLMSASLFIKSFVLARKENPGFRIDNVLVMPFNPALVGTYSNARIRALYREIQEQVNKLPGVRSAALGSHIPMGTDSQWNPVAPAEGGVGAQGSVSVMFDRVEPGYFNTMGIPILEGRAIEEADTPDSPAVAVVNETLARRFWPKGDALGQQIRFGDATNARVLQIVGITPTGKYQETIDQPAPYIYIPYQQQRSIPPMALFVHTVGDPAGMAPAIQEVMRRLAPDVPVYGVRTMREIFESHGLLGSRLIAQVLGAMAAIGLALGVAGLYAVIAFLVALRTKEIGIRMALGADSDSILRNVLASGVRVAAMGIAMGMAGAFAVTRYLAEFLDRVNPRDPITFFGISAFVLCVSLAACWFPARRASRIDPIVTLRYE